MLTLNFTFQDKQDIYDTDIFAWENLIIFTVKKKRVEYTSVKVLGAVKDVSIPQEPGGGDGDTRDHEPGEHPGAEVQLTQGH